jgi:hypothetical protein
MQRVNASATVDRRDDGKYSVDVWGEPPHNQRRHYVVDAPSEKDAAFSCIEQFVQEMERTAAEGTKPCQ